MSSACSILRTSFPACGEKSVATVPGQIALTLIPYCRRSSAMHSVNPSRPHLEAQYIPPPAKAFLPASDAILIMWPVRRSIIAGATALLSRNTAFRLVSNTASQSDSAAPWKGPKYPMPALLTSTSIAPRDCSVFCTSFPISFKRVTSAAVTTTLPPPPCSSAAALSSLSACREHKLSFAPRRPRLRATASPIPRLPPVTNATLPFSGFSATISSLQRGDSLPRYNIITLRWRRARTSGNPVFLNGSQHNLDSIPVSLVQEAGNNMRKSFAIIGAFLTVVGMLCLFVRPAAAQAQQDQNKPVPYTMPEYNGFQACHAETNAQMRVKCLDDFAAKFPNSSLMPYVLGLYYTTYDELKNYPKTVDYADKLVALGDKAGDAGTRLQALYIRTLAFNYAFSEKASDATDQLNKARAASLEGLRLISTITTKPANVTEDQFTQQKKALIVLFN